MNNDQNNLFNGMPGVGTFNNSSNVGPVPNPNDNFQNQSMPINNNIPTGDIGNMAPVTNEVPSPINVNNNMTTVEPINNTVPTMDVPTPVNTMPISEPSTNMVSTEPINSQVPSGIVSPMGVNNEVLGTPTPSEPINLQPMGRVEPVIEEPKPVEPTPLNGMNLTQMQQQVQVQNNMGVPINTMPNQGVNNINMNNNQMGSQAQPNGINTNIGFMGSVPVPPTINMPEGVTVKPQKEKKKLNKNVIIIIVLLLILGIGGGIFFFLNQSANKIVVTTGNGFVELGDASFIPTNITSYITKNIVSITGKDYRTKCSVSSPSLDVNKVGSYQYSVTCQGKTTQGQLVVKDTTAPTVVTKTVYVTPGKSVVAKDFIVDAKDYSGDPSVSLEKEIDTTTIGTQDIILIASDLYDNSIKVEAKLVVDNDAPVSYLRADKLVKVNSEATEMPELENAIVTKSFIFGVNASGNIYKDDLSEEVTYSFSGDKDNYELAKQDIMYSGNGLEDVFDTLVGHVSFSDSDMTIKVIIDLTISDVTSEFNVREIPASSSSLQSLLAEAGYTVSITGESSSYIDVDTSDNPSSDLDVSTGDDDIIIIG